MIAPTTARPGRAVLLSLMLLTSACASIPDLGPKPEPRSALDYASSESLAGTAAQWPSDGWWRSYGDVQLAQLMQEALASSPDLQAAAARLRTAEGFAQRAGAALKPQVDAFGSADMSKLSQNGTMPAAAVPNGWNDSGSCRPQLLARPRPVGQEPGRLPRGQPRRGCSALRTRGGATGPDYGHRFDLCRSGIALCAPRQPGVRAQDPHRRRRSSSRIAWKSASIRLPSRSRPKRACRRLAPTSKRRTRQSR